MKNGTKPSFKRDEKATRLLIEAGKKSGAEAVKESKALGLTITYLEDGWLINESAKGEKQKVKQQEIHETAVKLKKGMILHAKK